MTRLVNLTFHPITVYLPDGSLVTIPTAGPPARVDDVITPSGQISVDEKDIPVRSVATRGVVTDLPDASPGVGYIVSRLTAAAANRPDLYFPLDEVRENGVQVGCRALGHFAPSTEIGD